MLAACCLCRLTVFSLFRPSWFSHLPSLPFRCLESNTFLPGVLRATQPFRSYVVTYCPDNLSACDLQRRMRGCATVKKTIFPRRLRPSSFIFLFAVQALNPFQPLPTFLASLYALHALVSSPCRYHSLIAFSLLTDGGTDDLVSPFDSLRGLRL